VATHGVFQNTASPVSPVRAHGLFLLLSGAYFLSIFLRTSAAVVMPAEAERLGMSASLTGFLSSLHFYSYAFMQPVSGVLHDRFGPLRVTAAGMLLAALSNALVAWDSTPATLGAWRFVSGFGLAPMYSAALVFQAYAFRPERYCFYSAVNFTIADFGAVASVICLGFALDRFGVRGSFATLTLLCLLTSVSLLLQSRHDPVRRAPARPSGGGLRSLLSGLRGAAGTIRRSRSLLAILPCWIMSSSSHLAFQALWSVSWYTAAYGCAPSTARFWASLMGIGMTIGPLVASALGTRPERIRSLLIRSASANAIVWTCMVLSLTLRLPIWLSGALTLLSGLTIGVMGISIVGGVNEHAPAGEKGAIFGMMNMVTVLSAVVAQWGTGAIINCFPAAVAGTYAPAGYAASFWVVVAAIILSVFPLFLYRARD
jgi:MFS family permease